MLDLALCLIFEIALSEIMKRKGFRSNYLKIGVIIVENVGFILIRTKF